MTLTNPETQRRGDNTGNTGEALRDLGNSVKGGLKKSGEVTTETSKKIMQWFKDFFSNAKDKGLKESLLGPLVGFLSLIKNLNKKETDEKKTDSTDTRQELQNLAETCPALPVIPPMLFKEIPDDIRGTGKGIVKAVEVAVKNGIRGDHCWDWTDKVFMLAGCKRKGTFNTVPQYASKTYEMKDGKRVYKKTPDCGTHHAYEKEYAQLEPGDHIFVNNKNEYDNHGNHSEIFLGWVDKSKLIARTAGYPGKGKPPYISTSRNFNNTPITYMAKPIPIDKPPALVS